MKTKNLLFKSFLATFIIFITSCSNTVLPPAPQEPIPTERQLKWHKMEMNAFIHFTTNTFTDKEWGYGDESPQVFNPSDLNVDQWLEVLKDAGFKGVILTCKHHDGFCLWPSVFTEHSVKNSLWKNGKGNVVEEVSLACKKYGLSFGVYLSPWDRNRTDYGSPAYIDYYRNQLKELFTAYGPVFEMWFDGANGGNGYYGGSNEVRSIDGKTYYDWPGTLKMIREMEPEVIFFSDAGPDIRWCGNERGSAGETNWNTISTDTLYAGKPNINELLNNGSADGKNWVPAEVDVSIRPGWFYHESEDSLVKTPEQLFDIYLSSVGRGSNLLLNVPPDRTGHLNKQDVKTLKDWKTLLARTFSNNLAEASQIKVSSRRGGLRTEMFSAENITDTDYDSYWATNDDVKKADIELEFEKPELVSYVMIQEYIPLGQRIIAFSVEALEDGTWKEISKGTTIGYKRILKTIPTETTGIRIKILESKACPVICNLEVY
jgi:alpha-L-fucosidase